MPDFDAITIALAARFGPGTVTPPTGYDPIRLSTGDLPNQMTPLPTVLVYPEQGEFTQYPGKRDSGHTFLVRFYYNETGDMARDMVALRKWLTVLSDQLKGATMLGGIVTSANITSWKIGAMSYAGIDYSGIEFSVRIITNEPWAAVA